MTKPRKRKPGARGKRIIAKCEQCDKPFETFASSVARNARIGHRVFCGRECGYASKRTISDQRLYRVWMAMRQRCGNPNHKQYGYYGGRGIKVCERWEKSFDAFLTDMGPRPEGLTLERSDNDGGYEPGNCRWATQAEQNLNKRRPKRMRPLMEECRP